MVKDKIIKIRATPYEKAIVTELKKVSVMSGINILSESDVVRIALAAMAKQHLKPERLKEIAEEFGNEHS